jgi:hypothetical protein
VLVGSSYTEGCHLGGIIGIPWPGSEAGLGVLFLYNTVLSRRHVVISCHLCTVVCTFSPVTFQAVCSASSLCTLL